MPSFFRYAAIMFKQLEEIMNHSEGDTWLRLVTVVLLFIVMMVPFIIIFSEITT